MPEAIRNITYSDIKFFLLVLAIIVPGFAAWVDAKEDIQELQSKIETVENVPNHLSELSVVTARLEERVKVLIEKMDKVQ